MTPEIGDRVVYTPWPGAAPEYGIVKATHDRHAFVLFDGDTASKATPYDMLTDGPDLVHEPDPAPKQVTYWEVVTRYGGHKHLARKRWGNAYEEKGRHYTECSGTSSWTVAEWERHPDHPLLTLDAIKALPACPLCHMMTALRSGFVSRDYTDRWLQPVTETNWWHVTDEGRTP